MATRTPDDLMDERLRAAGARLRLESPTPSVTDATLAAVDRRGRASRPLRWVVPVGLVATAAAALGVLALTDGADQAEPEVPAVTPLVTAAPTVPAPSPAFAGNPPLSASAAALGCPGTLGELAAAIDSSLYPITGLACSRNQAIVFAGRDPSMGLRRRADGTWSRIAVGQDLTVDPLPIPHASLLVRDLGDLRPQDVTPEVRAEAAEIQVSDPELYAHSLGARLAVGQDPAPTVTAEVVDEADVFLITLAGLGDDSIGEVTYVVWYDPSPPVPTVVRAFVIPRCSRGVAVDEAGQPMDLCL